MLPASDDPQFVLFAAKFMPYLIIYSACKFDLCMPLFICLLLHPRSLPASLGNRKKVEMRETKKERNFTRLH